MDQKSIIQSLVTKILNSQLAQRCEHKKRNSNPSPMAYSSDVIRYIYNHKYTFQRVRFLEFSEVDFSENVYSYIAYRFKR